MNHIDQVFQQSFPSIMVPKLEAVAPMKLTGERLLIAANGVFLEIDRPWIRIVRRIATYSEKTSIPYGEMLDVTELRCPPVPPELVAQFYAMTRQALPNEVGAWIIWDKVTGLFRLVPLMPISHSPEHLHYERPQLRAGEFVVVDCHSHGRAQAFFSPEDNDDDQYDVKFALVLGHCHRHPSTAMRLCAKGIFETFEKIPEPWATALAEEVQS